MSATYPPDDDYPPPRSSRQPRAARPPYPNDNASYVSDSRRPRQPRFPEPELDPSMSGGIPPPPVGSAMKREGSRSRVPPGVRPEFPDEASYMGGRAPDLEGKNSRTDKKFREKRDGYESDEGESHRRRSRRPNDDDSEDDQPRRRRGQESYDEPPQSRRRRGQDPYYDDVPSPYGGSSRRRGDRPPPDVEYGAEPLKAPRRGAERDGARDRDRRRRDRYDDDEDDDDYGDRRRRARSHDAYDRPSRGGSSRYAEDDRYDDDRDRDRDRRRRDERDRDRDRDRYPARKDRRRRDSNGYDSYDDDYNRRDSRRDRDRRDKDRRRPPPEMKIGKYDVGPFVEQGRKHWGTLAPIVTPLIMNAVRNYGKK